VVFITASYGLGETVVQGAVNPDEFYVHKPTLAPGQAGGDPPQPRLQADQDGASEEAWPASQHPHRRCAEADRKRFSLTDADVLELGRYAMIIEQHYGRPMDIEWGKDGVDGKLYILQARPETVKSQRPATHGEVPPQAVRQGAHPRPRIGQKIGAGPVRVVKDASEMDRVQAGDVLVTDMTDPNWEPVMKRASAIVTNRGGRTCHAAIIARELGIPAIVGCGNATEVLARRRRSHRVLCRRRHRLRVPRQAGLRDRHHRHGQPARPSR
jgi:pyruvate,water dikinase